MQSNPWKEIPVKELLKKLLHCKFLVEKLTAPLNIICNFLGWCFIEYAVHSICSSPYFMFALKTCIYFAKIWVFYGLWPLPIFLQKCNDNFIMKHIYRKGHLGKRKEKSKKRNQQLFFHYKNSWCCDRLAVLENQMEKREHNKLCLILFYI